MSNTVGGHVSGCNRGKCRDCGKHQYVSPQAWGRASRPRCRDCGGTLDQHYPKPKVKCARCGEAAHEQVVINEKTYNLCDDCWAQFDKRTNHTFVQDNDPDEYPTGGMWMFG